MAIVPMVIAVPWLLHYRGSAGDVVERRVCGGEHRSTIITSNKAFGYWGEILGDDVIAAAMLDRFLNHCTCSISKAIASG